MENSNASVTECLGTASAVLWRCAMFAYALLLIWYAVAILPGNPICVWQGQLFGLTIHECALVNYGGMAFVKILTLLFFIFPWVAIRLVIKGRR